LFLFACFPWFLLRTFLFLLSPVICFVGKIGKKRHILASLDSEKYRIIHKSLRDFRILWYSSRDGHDGGSMSTEGETF
jgi:hypothetical protein